MNKLILKLLRFVPIWRDRQTIIITALDSMPEGVRKEIIIGLVARYQPNHHLHRDPPKRMKSLPVVDNFTEA